MGRQGRGCRVLDAGRSGVGWEDRAAGTPGEDGQSGWTARGLERGESGSWLGWPWWAEGESGGVGQAWGRGFGSKRDRFGEVLGREAPGLTDVL